LVSVLVSRQSADDDARVELAHDRFVMNDVARATARMNVLQNGIDPYSRMSLAVADLSGTDAIVTKKRRAGGAAAGSMYGYEDEDAEADDLDFDREGASRYMSATEMSSLAADEEAETEVYVL
jgi:hypothetical protein